MRNIACGTMISPSGSSIVPKVVFLNISVSFFNEVKYRSSVKPFIVRFWNLVPMGLKHYLGTVLIPSGLSFKIILKSNHLMN